MLYVCKYSQSHILFSKIQVTAPAFETITTLCQMQKIQKMKSHTLSNDSAQEKAYQLSLDCFLIGDI